MAALFNLLDDLPSDMHDTFTTTQTITGVVILPLLTYSPLPSHYQTSPQLLWPVHVTLQLIILVNVLSHLGATHLLLTTHNIHA